MTGFGAWLRLSFRLQRWEVLASALGVMLLAAMMLWFAWQLNALAAGAPNCNTLGEVVLQVVPAPTAACDAFFQRFYETSSWADNLLRLSQGAPFVVGVLLGVPIVAGEVESRTAAIAWTLSRSRVRWLARRVAFTALVVVGLLAVVAVVSEVLAGAIGRLELGQVVPDAKMGSDFRWYGQRGGLIVVRGLAALGIGLTVGMLVGRVLPGLLVAAFASVLVFAAVSLGMDRLNRTDAILQAGSVDPTGALFFGQRVELATGEVVTWEEMQRREPTVIIGAVSGEHGALFASELDLDDPSKVLGWDRALVVPGRFYPTVVLRESAVLGGAILLIGGLATWSLGRRRVD